MANKTRNQGRNVVTLDKLSDALAEHHADDVLDVDTDNKIGDAMEAVANANTNVNSNSDLDSDSNGDVRVATLVVTNEPTNGLADIDGHRTATSAPDIKPEAPPSVDALPTPLPAPKPETATEMAMRMLAEEDAKHLALRESLLAGIRIGSVTDRVHDVVRGNLALHTTKTPTPLGQALDEVLVSINVDLWYDATTKSIKVGRIPTAKHSNAITMPLSPGGTITKTAATSFATISKDGKTINVAKRGKLMDCPATEKLIMATWGVTIKLTGSSTTSRATTLENNGFTYTMA